MQIFRGVAVHADVKVTDESYRDFTVMGEDYLVIDFYSRDEIVFLKNDYCYVFGERFTIMEKPVPSLVRGVYHFNFKFYNTYRLLEKVKVFLYDLARDFTQSEFPYTCTPAQLVQLIVNNLNAVQDHDWTVGDVIDADARTLTISNQNCLELLTMAASEWETEWYVDGFEINLRERSVEAVPTKELALGTGLKSVDQEDNQQRAITRLYAFGGTRNLPAGYGYERLKMDVPYLDSGSDDVVEDLQVFDDIYPRRLGALTAVRQNASGIFFFEDSGIDFNPNALQVDGLTKHIIFQSGALVGYDFEVNWNETTEEFEIIRFTESSGTELPSANLVPAIGDAYIIYNVKMPASYVTAAEAELKAKAQAWFNENTTDRLSFNLTLDEVYFTANDMSLLPGEVVSLKHAYIDALKDGLNIRVTGFKRYINIPHRYEAVKVSDTVYVNPVSSVQGQVTELEKVIERNNLNRQGYTARNWRDVAELATMIDTLQTKLLIVGDEQGQFRLHGIVFTANYEGNANAFYATGGSLAHTTVPDFENPGSWNIPAFSAALSSDSTPYSLYAKCAKGGNTGEFVFDASFIAYDSDANYWYFLIGVISSKNGQYRSFQTVYGFSTISGNQITTGLIRSADGESYFDLDGNRLKLSDLLQYNVDGNGLLKLKGTLVQSESGVESPIGVFRGAYNAGYTYYKGDEVTYNGSTFRYINETAGSGHTPTEGTYWTVISAKGDQGIQGDQGPQGVQGDQGTTGNPGADGPFVEYRYAKNGSTTTSPNLTVTDVNPSGWATTPPATGALEYLWMTKAKKSYDGTALLENWSTPVRIKGEVGETGATGATGATGPAGPSIAFQGNYDAGKTYYGTSLRVDVVLYDSAYYVARTDAGTFSNVLPTNTSKWNAFGASFESIATGLLLAQLAYIENLGVKYLYTAQTGQRIEINRARDVNGNPIAPINMIELYRETDAFGSPTMKMTDASLQVYHSSTKFLRINETPTSPMMVIRADELTALDISTYGTGGRGIRALANTSGNGNVLETYGNVILTARSIETLELRGASMREIEITNYSTHSFSAAQNNVIDSNYSLAILNPTANDANVYRITQRGTTPVNGARMTLINNSTAYNVQIRSNITNSNIRIQNNGTTLGLYKNSSIDLVYYGGYWHVQQDFGA